MFAARLCVGEVSVFSRNLTDQTNGRRSLSNSPKLQFPRQLCFTIKHCPLPKFEFSRRNFSWRSSKDSDSLTPVPEHSTKYQLNQLKEEVARHDQEISNLKVTIQLVLQNLSGLQVGHLEEIPNIPTPKQPQAPTTPEPDHPNKAENEKVTRKRKLHKRSISHLAPNNVLGKRKFSKISDYGDKDDYCDGPDNKKSRVGDVDVTIGRIRDYT